LKQLEKQQNKLKEEILSSKEHSNGHSEDATEEEDFSESSDLSNSMKRNSSNLTQPYQHLKLDPGLKNSSYTDLPQISVQQTKKKEIKKQIETLNILESPMVKEDNSHVQSKLKLWREGIEKFNKGFKEGMNHFISNEIINNDPYSISKLLTQIADLSKVEIGLYLGKFLNLLNQKVIDVLIQKF
jgi:hypothetical protein